MLLFLTHLTYSSFLDVQSTDLPDKPVTCTIIDYPVLYEIITKKIVHGINVLSCESSWYYSSAVFAHSVSCTLFHILSNTKFLPKNNSWLTIPQGFPKITLGIFGKKTLGTGGITSIFQRLKYCKCVMLGNSK